MVRAGTGARWRHHAIRPPLNLFTGWLRGIVRVKRPLTATVAPNRLGSRSTRVFGQVNNHLGKSPDIKQYKRRQD